MHRARSPSSLRLSLRGLTPLRQRAESMLLRLAENRKSNIRVPVGHGAAHLHGFRIEHDVSEDYVARVSAVHEHAGRNLLITPADHALSPAQAGVVGPLHIAW